MFRPFIDFFLRFRTQSDGAVTVDWVVLTAALVALAIPVVGTVANGVETRTDAVTHCYRHLGNHLSRDWTDKTSRYNNTHCQR